MPTQTIVTHTPGPWRVTPHGERISIDAPQANFLGVARLNTTGSPALGIPDAQSKANARLIAAAPELFRVLEAIDRFWGDGICDAAVYPGAYLTEEDIEIRTLVHLAVNLAKGIKRP